MNWFQPLIWHFGNLDQLTAFHAYRGAELHKDWASKVMFKEAKIQCIFNAPVQETMRNNCLGMWEDTTTVLNDDQQTFLTQHH